ncbi:MAG: hypothetical protein FWF92_04705 [Oscillospiraceae bacterium]|nr:hypothetical protein [Oscillospiraceae bacterium]
MKKICLLLAFILFLSLLLISCGGNTEENKNITPKEAQDINANNEIVLDEETEPVTEKLLPNVPDDKDFDGYEFMILGNSTAYNTYWYSKDLYVEDENGDAINDAVYYRNRAIEEKYNIKINAKLSGSQYNDAKKSINSGDGTYDVFSVPLQGATAMLAQDGSLLDLKKVPYIDLDKPWWDQRANEQLSIGHKLMFTISDLLIIDKDALFIFLFNKDVIQEQGLEDPYKLVRDGKWTIDKMWDMAKDMPKDVNGDGKMDDLDAYRMLTAAHTIHGNVVGSGHFVITKDADDMPVLNITDPMIQASYEKWLNMMLDRNSTWVAQDWDSRHTDIWMYQLEVLSEKRGLWLYAGMDRVTTLRTFDFNFGILPNPKFDENQTDYYNHVHAWCTTAISIPVTSDPERTGMILEALTAESYYTLRPAYYDVSLKTKFMRDDESGEMLDLIFKTRCYDLGHVYNWGGLFDMFCNLPQQKNNDFVSGFEKIMPKIERDMEKAIENFLENE